MDGRGTRGGSGQGDLGERIAVLSLWSSMSLWSLYLISEAHLYVQFLCTLPRIYLHASYAING